MTDGRTFLTDSLRFAWRRRWLLTAIVFGGILYSWYISGLSENPPGFYLDESAGAYNAYLLARTGSSERGEMPIIPQYYTDSKTETANPVHLYMLAVMYRFVPASNLAARIMAASTVFLACILLGVLAYRLSARRSIGVIVTLIALATPWLFEASRLVLEVFVCPLAFVLLLLFLERARRRGVWSLSDQILLGLSLALITYSYTIGRLLGPLFGLGLLMFVRSWRDLFNVVKTGVFYVIALWPFLYVYFTDNSRITKRFNHITYVNFDKPWGQLWTEFSESYLQDISLTFLLDKGDPLLRHHVPGMGGILAGVFALAMVGIAVALIKYRRDPFWWFVIFCLLASVLPGALTTQRFHFLRIIGFPVFLTVLTVPAMMWLLGDKVRESRTGQSFSEWLDSQPERIISWFFDRGWSWSRAFGKAVLVVILILVFDQAYEFQTQYKTAGPSRGFYFDQSYPEALNAALARPERPIYLEDGTWGPAYVHAYWYSTQMGVDLSNYVHLGDYDKPPIGGLVLSSNSDCKQCEVIGRYGSYLLYKPTGAESGVPPENAIIQPMPGP